MEWKFVGQEEDPNWYLEEENSMEEERRGPPRKHIAGPPFITFKEFCEALRCGKTSGYNNLYRVRSVKFGAKRLIVTESVNQLIDELLAEGDK